MTPRRILLAGWFVFALYAYPGFLMSDAGDQIIDSRYGTFSDWHSPLLTQVFGIVELIVSGPAGMLALQSGLLLFGTYSIVRRSVSDRAAAGIAVAALLLPPLIATNAVVCAEAQLASWLVAGCALLLSERFSRRVGGLAMCAVAMGFHAGAHLAALPIIIATFTWRTPQPRWRRVLIAIAAWAVAAAFSYSANRVLIDRSTTRHEVRLAIVDIVGVLKHAPKLDDARARALLGDFKVDGTDIQAHARQMVVIDQSDSDQSRHALLAARERLIHAYPKAYLAHRVDMLAGITGFRRPGFWSPVYTSFTASPAQTQVLQHDSRHSLAQRILIAPVHALRMTPVFRPFYYVGLAIVLLAFAAWKRRRIESVLLASALVYEIAWMFLAPRIEYRDSHPMLVLTLIAACWLLASRIAPQKHQ